MPTGRYRRILSSCEPRRGDGRPLMPAQPETTQERGFGPFVTFVVRKRPDGVIARWESRAHRKHLHEPRHSARRGGRRAIATGGWACCSPSARSCSRWARCPHTRTPWARGPTWSRSSSGRCSSPRPASCNTARRSMPRPGDWYRPPQGLRVPAGQIDWLATAVQSVGTVEFNISTFVAIWATVGSAQARHHVWRPDILGSPASWSPARSPGSRRVTAGRLGGRDRWPGGSPG